MLFFGAFRFGDEPERVIATIFVGIAITVQGYAQLAENSLSFSNTDIFYLVVDAIALSLLIAVALKANRMYPLWMAGFQIIALLAHFAKGMTEDISPIAYVILVVGPSYFQIIILAFGIWLHHRRTRRHGSYRPWRNSSRHSPVSAHRN